ncbi:hypothetical protein [Salipiger mucosus]|uniref:hypothetical protein n=1 Tax=Salipiger mucosus TaxID=263378 RepID=UPI0012EC75FB|nr:hypothetical protein [Salipiger mucosus]
MDLLMPKDSDFAALRAVFLENFEVIDSAEVYRRAGLIDENVWQSVSILPRPPPVLHPERAALGWR